VEWRSTMAMELKTKNQRLAPQANCLPPTWHAKCRSGFATLPLELLLELPDVVLLWGRPLASWLLAIDEHSGLEGLHGLGRRSVIHYVHGRTMLYCSSLYEPKPFLFSTPQKWRPPEPFIAQGQVVYNEPLRLDRCPPSR
jgi:hypothetical protein